MGGSPGRMAAFAPTAAGTFDLPAIRREFDASGLVILHDVIEPAAFEGLQTMVDLQCVRSVLEGAWPEDLATNERWQQGLPPASFTPGHGGADWPRTTPWLSPALIANPAVEAVVEALLGPGCRLTGLSGNTAMPGSGLQYLHVDTLALPTEPKTTHVVVNFSCGPYGPANGATELWQGSHNDPSWDSHRRADDMQLEQHCHEAVVARRAVAPPIQPEIPVGGCLIRDMRAPLPLRVPPALLTPCSADEACSQGCGIAASPTPATPLGPCSR